MADAFDKIDVFDDLDIFDTLDQRFKNYTPPPRVAITLTDEIRAMLMAEVAAHVKGNISAIVAEVKPERVIHTIERQLSAPPERVIVKEVDMVALERAIEERLKKKFLDYEKNWKNIAPIVVPNGIPNMEGKSGKVLSTDGRIGIWITSPSTGGGTANFFDYTMSNVTSRLSFDASNTSLDEIADVIGTLAIALAAAPSPFVLAAFTVTNVTSRVTYDADNTSMDEIANTLGTLITSLQNGTLDTYTITNAHYVHTCDADNTSLDEISDVLGSIIASCRGAGIIQ